VTSIENIYAFDLAVAFRGSQSSSVTTVSDAKYGTTFAGFLCVLLLSPMTQHLHFFIAYFVKSEKTTSQKSQIANTDRKERKLRCFLYNPP
jgi:hypothetical protein